MSYRNTKTSYGSVAKWFHWAIFFLLLFQVIYGYFLDDFPKDYQPFVYNTHKLLGLLILLIMVLRLIWALMNPKPAMPIGTLIWQRWAERFVHAGLYIVVIAMPIVGLVGSDAAGRPPHIGDFKFMLPISENKDLADSAFTLHNNLAIALIALVAVHVLAALYHHFVKRDNVLRRML